VMGEGPVFVTGRSLFFDMGGACFPLRGSSLFSVIGEEPFFMGRSLFL